MVLSKVEIQRPSADAAVVFLQGEHDLTTKDALGALLAQLVATNRLVVVDVSEAKLIDSSVINNLLKANRLARERKVAFRLQMGTAPIVRRVIEISGVLGLLESASSPEEVLTPRAALPGEDAPSGG